MEPRAAAEALLDALIRRGVEVREEPLPPETTRSGGLCVLHGRQTLFIAPDAPPVERVHVLAAALRRVGADEIWLPPAVRALLEEDP